jgi:purine nucleoside permease
MAALAVASAAAKERPIAVKVVVVTMFERGADTGDEPGEFQYWVERNKLDRVIRFPQGYQSLTFLARAGRVDVNRVMVLRTASDFDQPRPGMSAAESLAQTKIGQYSGYLPALEAAWRVGNTVVAALLKNWKEYRERVPGGRR